MRRVNQRLRRGVVTLAALLLVIMMMGWTPSPTVAAPKGLIPPLLIQEPQIPEYELVQAERRQAALQRVSRIQSWAAQEAAHELSEEHQAQVQSESAVRQERLEGIADLVPESYRQMVLDVAAQYEVDPRLVAAIGRVESRWNPNVVGTHDDTGLMQILPSTAEWIASKMGIEEYDLFDPLTNVTMGTWYLHVLIQEYGSWDQALAAYNGGPRGALLGADHPYVGLIKRFYDYSGSGS